ncbi:hypothetical protein ABPG72_012141 [Tetrahymena utriculariae]
MTFGSEDQISQIFFLRKIYIQCTVPLEITFPPYKKQQSKHQQNFSNKILKNKRQQKLQQLRNQRGMEVEQSYDTPEYIIGQISALKLLGYSNRQAAEQITQWGYSISHTSVGNQWQKYQSGDISSNRQNSGRKSRINSEVKDKMIDEVLNNRYMTAAEMSRNQDLNPDNCSVSAIKRMLSDEGLKSYRPQIIPYITNINKEKRFQFAKQVQKWKDKWNRIVFSDECYVRAESNHLRYVRRFSGEELSEEYCIKKSTFKKGFFVLIWGAISVNGSEQLFFADGTIDSELYLKVIQNTLPKIQKLAAEIDSQESLKNIVKEIFFSEKAILQTVQNSYSSMNSRIQKVLQMEGGYSGY